MNTLGLVLFQDLHCDTDSGLSWAGMLHATAAQVRNQCIQGPVPSLRDFGRTLEDKQENNSVLNMELQYMVNSLTPSPTNPHIQMFKTINIIISCDSST